MNHGHIEQVGTATEVYRRPASAFAATFVGNANVLPVDVVSSDGNVAEVMLGRTRLTVPCAGNLPRSAWIVIRPEVVAVAGEGRPGLVSGIVRDTAYGGAGVTYKVEVEGVGSALRAEVPVHGSGPEAEIGTRLELTWELEACRLIPRQSSEDRAVWSPTSAPGA